MTLLAMYLHHMQHAHTDEQRAAAKGLADEVQGDTYPADLIWAAQGTRALTAEELAVIYPIWIEYANPRGSDITPRFANLRDGGNLPARPGMIRDAIKDAIKLAIIVGIWMVIYVVTP
jgi:hypothetical protein